MIPSKFIIWLIKETKLETTLTLQPAYLVDVFFLNTEFSLSGLREGLWNSSL